MPTNEMSNSAVLTLAMDLISRPSITPLDEGCQELFIKRLSQLGFQIETMVFEDTVNLWARKGNKAPLFCFAGHTDVVPPGDAANWNTPPFEPTIIDGVLYGRGAADMKGSLAATLIAVEQFVEQHPEHIGSLAFLITSDEEGPFINGTTRVVDTLMARNELIDYCIVAEPSSTTKVGDVIKNGRRGSITGELTVIGIQGHVAYPHLADNPVHKAMPALNELAAKEWDQGNEFFPATSFQIANIQAGTGASNVIPGALEVMFNFRFSTELTSEQIKTQVHAILDKHQLNYELNWILSGEPFLTGQGELLDAASLAVHKLKGYQPEALTTGGTSDGRFIAKMGGQIIELGPVNATIHKVNECVQISELEDLVTIYQSTLEQLLLK